MDMLELTDLIRTVTLDNGDEARAIDFLRQRAILRSEAPLCPRLNCRRQMTQALLYLTLNVI